MNVLHPTPSATPGRTRRRGQTLIFVMMALAILSFVMFSVYDVQQVASARVRAQNASDAAALAGARWQLTTLNAIGELNLLKLTTAIIDSPPQPYTGPVPADRWWSLFTDISNGVDGLQERLARIGPLLGVFHAQQAAKLNGMHVVPAYAQSFSDIAAWISTHATDYPAYYQTELVPLLQEIVSQGVAALPAGALGNPGSYDLSEASAWARYLLARRFYEAIAAQDWCYLRTLLNAPYTDATSFWGIIRPGEPPDPLQFLPLWVVPQFFSPDNLAQLRGSVPAIQNLASLRNLEINPNFPAYTGDTNYPHFSEPTDRFYVPLQLFCYQGQWAWSGNDDQAEALLMSSQFRPQSRYKGADSVWTVQGTANVVMAPANPDQVSWTSQREQAGLRTAFNELAYLTNRVGRIGYGIQGSAAAKPFGQIPPSDTSPPPDGEAPNSVPLVLPVFTHVRLIPIAFSSGTAEFDPLWFLHLRDHLYPYTSQGIGAISPGCPYCASLIMWENPAFRQIGLDWLAERSQGGADPCPPGGSGGWNSNGGMIVH